MSPIQITCQDGYILQGHFWPKKDNTISKKPVLLGPATGIVQGFYKHFAQYLSEQGHDVLSFDFRGIGASLYGPLKSSNASLTDWGRYDLPAAIDALLDLSQQDSINLVGHSAGGQLLGLVHNHEKISNVVTIAASTGNIRNLTGKTKLLAPMMFNVLFPISCFFKGYGATKMINMGENLPKNVAKQWGLFCSKPGYAKNAIKSGVVDYHEEITCPITAISATDDEIASEQNVADLLKLYPKAKTQLLMIKPQEHQQQSIGHMQLFRRSHQNLWPLVTTHLL